MDGFINVLKPPGMSSHDVVGRLRRILQTKKIGHAGTLDPGAAGVLPVAVGRATRLIEYLEATDKSYRAEVLFGLRTDTDDDTGNILETRTFTMPAEEMIESALEAFRGTIRQRPPICSAIKVDGTRAYTHAREGSRIELPLREIVIHRLTLLERRADALLLDVTCSKGTYIRSLCRDLGEALGTPATMGFLLRTRVGDFSVDTAYTLEELETVGSDAILAPELYLTHLVRYDLPTHRLQAFYNGLSTTVKGTESLHGPLAVYSEGVFVGIGICDGETCELKAKKVYRMIAHGNGKSDVFERE
ncbi:tRNA pseudouridine(55) synthase TruB [Selenomonas sp. TAMA-11512]|uniref:tRNA pseudouridine(55) synthase TruB n=1 Tax=Selenomonas sp. TAMA-11512 TaxID=3095337 RepID=UPI003090099F|nr:tRNA pseudouridine(55) synthase TruB [Selenomonas sp. TAMA-11512]